MFQKLINENLPAVDNFTKIETSRNNKQLHILKNIFNIVLCLIHCLESFLEWWTIQRCFSIYMMRLVNTLNEYTFRFVFTKENSYRKMSFGKMFFSIDDIPVNLLKKVYSMLIDFYVTLFLPSVTRNFQHKISFRLAYPFSPPFFPPFLPPFCIIIILNVYFINDFRIWIEEMIFFFFF